MNSQTVEITSAGIRKILNKYTPERAIAEYVWNGFDAKATVVNIDFEIDNAELCVEICGTEYHTWGIITQYGLLNSWEMEQGS